MDLLAIVLIILSPLFLASSIILDKIGVKEYVTIPLIFACVLSIGTGLIVFNLVVTYTVKKMNESHFKLSKKISYMSSKKVIDNVVFYKNAKGMWENNLLKYPVLFDLSFIVLKKSFILSYAIRAIRYPRISNQIPVFNLRKYILSGFPKSLFFSVTFINKKRVKRYKILKNGVSIYRPIPWLITAIKIPHQKHYGHSIEWFESSIIKLDEQAFYYHVMPLKIIRERESKDK